MFRLVFLIGLSYDLGSLGSASSDFKVISLSDGNWSGLSRDAKKFLSLVKVPGGVYSDCVRNGEINDYLFYDRNDYNTRWIGKSNWEYTTEFDMTSEEVASKYIEMVFYGIDTVADVYVNQKHVGHTNNMFTRYSFDVKRYVKEGRNNVSVAFTSPTRVAKELAKIQPYTIPPQCPDVGYHGECFVNLLRKMQASFAWDWGPAMPSLGLWKPVDLVLSSFPARLETIGAYVDANRSTDDHWLLRITAGFDLLGDSRQSELVRGWIKVGLNADNGENVGTQAPFSIKPNRTQHAEAKITLRVPKKSVQLWWPRGYGKQPLYTLHLSVRPSFGDQRPVQRKRVRVGFRTVELIQDEIAPGNSSAGRTFYFKVNGVPIFAKGSNLIPIDILPEKSDSDKMKHLLTSSAEANFNMLRIWGGGLYGSDKFYEICDSLGLMVWQDMMFACSMYPTNSKFLASVRNEIRQQIQRMQHHPSLVMYSGNNENEAALRQNWYGTESNYDLYKRDYVKLYVENIEPLFKKYDPSRPYTLASPTNGIESVEEGYIAENPQDPLFGDIHTYNYLGNNWDWKIFPVPRFASEYGIQSLPSYWVLKDVLPRDQLTWLSESLQWRQHAPLGFTYMKHEIVTNLPWSSNLSDVVYLSQVNQAMSIKTQTEHYRRFKTALDDANQGMTMGALYWQVNDVWETSSWSSIDYRGNWKMLHYFARKFFSDVIVVAVPTADGRLLVWAVTDIQAPLYSKLTTRVHQWDTFNATVLRQDVVDLEASHSGEVYQATIDDLLNGTKAVNTFFSFELTGAPTNYFFPSNLSKTNYLDSNVTISRRQLLDKTTAIIELRAEYPALFVWLEPSEQVFGARFSDNGFHMTTPVVTVNFTSPTPLTTSVVDSIYVTYLKTSY